MRALGNRSILADPSNINIVQKINEQIKIEIFGCLCFSILKEKHKKFLKIKILLASI